MNAVEAEGLHTYYAKSHILHGVSLRARRILETKKERLLVNYIQIGIDHFALARDSLAIAAATVGVATGAALGVMSVGALAV